MVTVTTDEPTPPDADEETPPDAEEERDGGEMTLMGHLLELRSRVTWMAGAVVVGMCIFFPFPINFAIWEFLLEPARSRIEGFEAQAIEPLENLGVYFRIALACGLAVAMPMLVYQTMRFVAPALTKKERRWIYPIAGGASFAFLAGMAFAYYLVLPAAYGFLFQFASDLASPTPRISSYMDLTLRLIVILGLVFEMPILIMGLARMRVVHWAQAARLVAHRDHRRLRGLRDRDTDDRPRDAIARGRPDDRALRARYRSRLDRAAEVRLARRTT